MYSFDLDNTKILTDHEIQQIIIRAVTPRYKRKIRKNKFLKDYNIRQSELDNLHTIYSNDITIRSIFNNFIFSGETVNALIRRDMTQAVKWGECFIYFLSGIPGSGKSWFALDMASRYSRTYHEVIKAPIRASWYLDADDYSKPTLSYRKGASPEETVSLYMTYSNSNTTSALQLAKERSLIVQDESPIQHGKGSKIIKDQLVNVVKIAARRNTINLFIINPTIFRIDDVNYYFRILGKNLETGTTIALLYNSEMVPIGITKHKINLPKFLTKKYEELSKIQKTNIQQLAGHSGVSLTSEELDRLARLLIRETADKNISKSSDFEKYSALVNEVGGHMYNKLICKEASRLIATGSVSASDLGDDSEDLKQVEKVDEKEEEKEADVKENLKKSLETKKNLSIFEKLSYLDFLRFAISKVNKIDYKIVTKRDQSIYKYWLRGMTFAEIGDIYNKQPSTISTVVRKFREGTKENINVCSVGKLFERYVAVGLGADEDETAAYTHHPDLVFNGLICTIKFLSSRQVNSFEVDRDFAPEVEEAKLKGKKKIYLIYFNLASHNKKIFVKMIYFNKIKRITIDLNNRHKTIARDQLISKSETSKT